MTRAKTDHQPSQVIAAADINTLAVVANAAADAVAAVAAVNTTQTADIDALEAALAGKVSIDPETGQISPALVPGASVPVDVTAKQLSVGAPTVGAVAGGITYRLPTALSRLYLTSDTAVSSGTYTVRVKRASGTVLGQATLTSAQTIGTALVTTPGSGGTAYGIARTAPEQLFVEVTSLGVGGSNLVLYVEALASLAVSADPVAPTQVTDTFTGTDGTPPSTARWTVALPTDGTGSLLLQSNRARFQSGTTGGYSTSADAALIAVPGMSARQDMRVTWTSNTTTTGDGEFQIAVRGSGGSRYDSNAYQLMVQPGLGNFKVWKITGGAPTEIVSPVNKTLGTNVDVKGKLEITGSTIRGRLWTGATEPTSWDFTVVDTGVTAAGVVWFRQTGGNAAGADVTNLDDVTIELL